jgi:hypothetical protein
MEKIAIGVPYEISIEPSIDIGKFDAELMLNKTDFQIGIKLKKIKGEDIDYTFTIPTKLKDTLKKAKVSYSIFVYKENARFEVDSGDIKFIDEKDFKVQVKDNAKMRPMEEPEEEKKDKPETKKSESTPKPSPSAKEVKESTAFDPIDFAEELIGRNLEADSVVDEVVVEKKTEEAVTPKPTPLPLTQPAPTASKAEKNLHAILTEIEERKQKMARRDQVNKNIRDAIHKKD